MLTISTKPPKNKMFTHLLAKRNKRAIRTPIISIPPNAINAQIARLTFNIKTQKEQ
jgi:hypothetical protein